MHLKARYIACLIVMLGFSAQAKNPGHHPDYGDESFWASYRIFLVEIEGQSGDAPPKWTFQVKKELTSPAQDPGKLEYLQREFILYSRDDLVDEPLQVGQKGIFCVSLGGKDHYHFFERFTNKASGESVVSALSRIAAIRTAIDKVAQCDMELERNFNEILTTYILKFLINSQARTLKANSITRLENLRKDESSPAQMRILAGQYEFGIRSPSPANHAQWIKQSILAASRMSQADFFAFLTEFLKSASDKVEKFDFLISYVDDQSHPAALRHVCIQPLYTSQFIDFANPSSEPLERVLKCLERWVEDTKSEIRFAAAIGFRQILRYSIQQCKDEKLVIALKKRALSNVEKVSAKAATADEKADLQVELKDMKSFERED